MSETLEPRRITRETFQRMVDSGVFDNPRSVTLMAGYVVVRKAASPQHVMSRHLAFDALSSAFGSGWYIRTRAPLLLDEYEDPEPDISVLRGTADDYPQHPRTAPLVVEISDATLRTDRGRKASLYARAGIADYWIVNLAGRTVEVRRRPVRDASQEFGWGYASLTTLAEGETASPLAKPEAVIRVADLLPREPEGQPPAEGSK